MKPFIVVVSKELRDNLRDRRTLFVAMLLPLFTPLTLGLVLVWNVHNQIEHFDAPLTLPVKGLERGSYLAQALRENGCELTDAVGDPIERVRGAQDDVVLIVKDAFDSDVRAGIVSEVTIIADSGRQDSQRAAQRVHQVVDGVAHTLGIVRLIDRGVDPAVLTPFAIAEHDVATPEARMAFLFAGVPFTLVMLAFMGGLYVAIDTTAGERERNSFEALMLNPVPRAAVAFGKLFAVTLFAWLALVVSAAGLVALPHILPERALDVPLKLDLTTILRSVVLLVPLTFLASALQTVIATGAKGFKEAQATLSYVVLLPMIPSMVQMLMQPELRASVMWIPALSEQLIINAWLRNESVPAGLIAMTVASTTLIALVFGWLVVRRYDDERTFLP